MQATHTYLQIHPDDNILVALQDLPKGTEIRHNGHQFSLIENVAGKHKFTMNDLARRRRDLHVWCFGGEGRQADPAGRRTHHRQYSSCFQRFCIWEKGSCSGNNLT